ncbi:hypothetical protein JN00_0205 [Metamycoplasma subdolum]|uniref:HipA-like kinase domain-containing protein n=1 Tax=Metamycoplasma subdolum TaxID=92407 RepID=A0A3M0A1Q0_9BACT|nr:HipA family kinase [Metamycoplasma subdolum]RMA78566.1 hypothetical protein JN00_0205 [Metamycoplasma subdolum]WPB50295.1 HipA family kinase [Metamycoplasma subdolum]
MIKKYFFRNQDFICFSFNYDLNKQEISSLNKEADFSKCPIFLSNFEPSIIQEYLEYERPTPLNRQGYENLFDKKFNPFSFYEIGLGLSMLDNFWICDEKSLNLKWKDINLFDNFKNEIDNIFLLSNIQKEKIKVENKHIFSPDFMLPGELRKSIKKEEDKFYLKKANSKFGSKIEYMQIYAEFFASQIAKQLELNAVYYDIENIEENLVNTCEWFIKKGENFIPFSTLFIKGNDSKESLIKNLNIVFGKENFQNLMLFDSIILNVDRHLGNFGIIVDSLTNSFISPAPIYDNGKSFLFDFNLYDKKSLKFSLENYGGRIVNLWPSFDQQMFENLDIRHKIWIDKLEDFELKNHEDFPAPSKYFKACKKMLKDQVEKLKNYYSVKFEKITE